MKWIFWLCVPLILVLVVALLPLAFVAEWFELFGKAPERERHTLSGRV